MRTGLALGFIVAVTGCGGSVQESVEGAAGHPPLAAAGSPGGSGSAPADAVGGLQPTLVGSAGDGGVEPAEDGGDSGGGVRPALTGAAGALDETTRSLVDEPLLPRGFLSALQYRSDSEHASVYSVEAIFETTRGQWDGCTRVQRGECWYYDCPPGSVPYLPSVPLQDAGALSLSTAGDPATSVRVGLLYDFWYGADGTAELWPAIGKPLTFSATGHTVPPFSLVVPSPPSVALTTLNGEVTPKSIARSAGVTLRWTSDGPGIATFSLYGFYERRFAAVCEFDAAANAGQLPASLLQELEPGPSYSLTFRGTSRARAVVDGWQLDASLSGYAGPLYPYDPLIIELR